jgi:hypothetical protein
MFGRRSASFRAADLTRAALTPIAVRHGIDYDESGFTAPASQEELGFEALRCCSGLVMAFAYDDAWPADDRTLRKLAKQAAGLVRDSFHDDAGRDAIAWAARRYGEVMAELRRAAAEEDPEQADAYRTTADADEHLGGLAARLWPVDADHPAIDFARAVCAHRPPRASRNADTLEGMGPALRTAATVEALSLATWPSTPDLEAAIMRWTYVLDLQFAAGVLADWQLTGSYWANLIGPDPMPYTDMVDIVASEHGM